MVNLALTPEPRFDRGATFRCSDFIRKEPELAEIINLNRMRKQKLRQEQKREAAVNRAAFGRTKEERRSQKSQQERQERDLDNKRLD